ncbi:putative holin-like toxin [Neobacillus driksii]|nr:putative holin-like toxin [Neobacillus niacini]
MTVIEALMLVIGFASLIVTILSFKTTKIIHP